MSKKEKLINRLKSKPRDMTFAEVETLLLSLGFEMYNRSGSRVIFIRGIDKIRIHKPHKRNYLLDYQVKEILDTLNAGGLV